MKYCSEAFDMACIVYTYTFPTRTQYRPNPFPLFRRNIRRTTPHRHSLSNRGWRIWHASYNFFKSTLHIRINRLARHNTQQNCILPNRTLAQFRPKGRCQILWLDTTQNQISILDDMSETVRNATAILFSDGFHGG
jgi:hypothetical protein